MTRPATHFVSLESLAAYEDLITRFGPYIPRAELKDFHRAAAEIARAAYADVRVATGAGRMRKLRPENERNGCER